MTKKATRSYEDDLQNRLKDDDFVVNYLCECLAQDREESGKTFLLALMDVVKSRGITKTANEADLGRDVIYKALAEDGNPSYETLIKILKALGIRFEVAKDAKEVQRPESHRRRSANL